MNDLSSYGGRGGVQVDEEVLRAYEGGGGVMRESDMFDFGGISKTFADSIKSARQFKVTITNLLATDEEIYLTPGPLYHAQATIADGVLRTETNPLAAYASVAGTALAFTSQGSPNTIENFLQFIYNNPTRLLGMKITSTLADQMEEALIIDRISPFKSNLESTPKFLASYQDENTFRDKVVTIPLMEQLDNQTVIRLNIKADSTINITFYCGAIMNQAVVLDKQARKAFNASQQGRVIAPGGYPTKKLY